MWKAKSAVVTSGDGALCKAASDRAVPDDRRAGEGAIRSASGGRISRRRREGAADIVYPVRYSLSNVVYFFAGLTFLRNAADGVNFTV